MKKHLILGICFVCVNLGAELPIQNEVKHYPAGWSGPSQTSILA